MKKKKETFGKEDFCRNPSHKRQVERSLHLKCFITVYRDTDRKTSTNKQRFTLNKYQVCSVKCNALHNLKIINFAGQQNLQTHEHLLPLQAAFLTQGHRSRWQFSFGNTGVHWQKAILPSQRARAVIAISCCIYVCKGGHNQINVISNFNHPNEASLTFILASLCEG